jgi:hypothetical protein
MSEHTDEPARGIQFGTEEPRELDIRITAAKGCGFTVTDMSAPDEGIVCAFSDWRDCLAMLRELLSALPGEPPPQTGARDGANGRTRERGFWGR